MFALLKKCRHLELPISVQFELFNSLVRPILTYGSEIWGYNCVNIIESLHLEFCKYVLHMKKSTPNCFVYGESGQYPLSIHVNSRMITFWHKLFLDTEGKMSSNLLKTLYECNNYNIYKSEWLTKIKIILDNRYVDYQQSCLLLNVQSLQLRSVKLSLTFGLKCLQSSKLKNLFKKVNFPFYYTLVFVMYLGIKIIWKLC